METTKIQPGATVYYYTFTVIHWLPVFVSSEACKIITDSLNLCHNKKGLRINAYVIMPTHCHLIVFDKDHDNDQLAKTVAAMRQFTGRQLIEFSEKKMPSVFAQLMHSPNRQDRSRQFWQRSKRPIGIWSQPFWLTKFNYLHANPVRKGLVLEPKDWRFSSASFWHEPDERQNDAILSNIEW